MRIIFLSTTCSRNSYKKICEKRLMPLLDSSQKFFEMFINGFREIEDISIECVSLKPLSHSTYPDLIIREEEEEIGNVHYRYVGFVNYPVLRTVTAQKNMMRMIKDIICNINEEAVIVADPLCLECSKVAIKTGKKIIFRQSGF